MLWRCHHKRILTQVCAFTSENLALKDPSVWYKRALRRLTLRCVGDMRPHDNHTLHNTLGKKKKKKNPSKSVQMEALFCLFISSRTNAAQRRSSSVAFRGANKIILVCVLLSLRPLHLRCFWGGSGVGGGRLLWVPVCCAMKRVECILHSWVTNPHDVIVMLTQCFFCTRYPQDKRKIKRGGRSGNLVRSPHSPPPPPPAPLIKLFICF